MKKLFQSLANGETTIESVTPPVPREGELLIQSICSLVSAGTERMLVDFGKASLIGKARQQPDRVKSVVEKVRTDGLVRTFDAVKAKLDKPITLGYSNVGVVTEVGKGVEGFSVGDRIVSNGCHSEFVCVPANLCATVPDNVASERAAFTVLASIGLQGIRLVNPTLGESIVVIGVGLIGLLTVQLLRAQGCRVLAIDIDDNKLEQAVQFGAEICNSNKSDPVEAGLQFSAGHGVDAVLITASSESNEIVSHAAKMSRKRGRIVMVGVTGLNLNRADFYEKELTFQVSCSYGPGRYDPDYEEKGQDYPIGYVRWTEQRNFQAVLQLMSDDSLPCESLISGKYDFEQAPLAYEKLVQDKSSFGLLLKYTEQADSANRIALRSKFSADNAGDGISVALVGLGNYASSILVPALRSSGAKLHTVISSSASSSQTKGAEFLYQSNNLNEVLQADDVDLIVITSRHNDHAGQVASALEAGKHVFVEKPLCLTLEQLEQIRHAYKQSDRMLMVGFNRRFAPLVLRIKDLLASNTSAVALTMTVNAGAVPSDHWIQDKKVGGGRIVGETCHFIDLMRFLAGSEVKDSNIYYMDSISHDSAVVSLKFENGTVATINYFANGHASLPKERLEVFSAGRVIRLDNFRKLSLYGWPGFRKNFSKPQNKGQNECVQKLLDALHDGEKAPIPAEEIFEVSRIAIELADSV